MSDVDNDEMNDTTAEEAVKTTAVTDATSDRPADETSVSPAAAVAAVEETRVSPATAQDAEGEGEAAAKPAFPKRAGIIAAVACCLVAVATIAGAFGGFSQPASQGGSAEQTTVSQEADGSDAQGGQGQDGGTAADGQGDAAAGDQAAADATDQSQAPAQDGASDQGSDGSASGDQQGGSSAGSGGNSSSNSSSSGSSSGSTTTEPEADPDPEPTPAPAPTPEPDYTPTPQPATIQVYITIDSSRANHYDSSWPTSMGGGTVTLAQGASVYDALCALGVSVGGNSYYVSSINGLAEKACGGGSGWTYSVDGVYPNRACGRYTLSGGETIRWVYSTDDEPTISM